MPSDIISNEQPNNNASIMVRLYRECDFKFLLFNPFRVLGLAANTSARTLKRHVERYGLQGKLQGDNVTSELQAFQIAANFVLQSPWHRLVAECFWFVVRTDDLTRLGTQELPAILEQAKINIDAGLVFPCIHDRAVANLITMLDMPEQQLIEAKIDNAEMKISFVSRLLETIIADWKEVQLNNAGLRTHLRVRIEQLADPRLDQSFADQLVDGILTIVVRSIGERLFTVLPPATHGNELANIFNPLVTVAAKDSTVANAMTMLLDPYRQRWDALVGQLEQRCRDESDSALEHIELFEQRTTDVRGVFDALMAANNTLNEHLLDRAADAMLSGLDKLNGKEQGPELAESILARAVTMAGGTAKRLALQERRATIRTEIANYLGYFSPAFHELEDLELKDDLRECHDVLNNDGPQQALEKLAPIYCYRSDGAAVRFAVASVLDDAGRIHMQQAISISHERSATLSELYCCSPAQATYAFRCQACNGFFGQTRINLQTDRGTYVICQTCHSKIEREQKLIQQRTGEAFSEALGMYLVLHQLIPQNERVRDLVKSLNDLFREQSWNSIKPDTEQTRKKLGLYSLPAILVRLSSLYPTSKDTLDAERLIDDSRCLFQLLIRAIDVGISNPRLCTKLLRIGCRRVTDHTDWQKERGPIVARLATYAASHPDLAVLKALLAHPDANKYSDNFTSSFEHAPFWRGNRIRKLLVQYFQDTNSERAAYYQHRISGIRHRQIFYVLGIGLLTVGISFGTITYLQYVQREAPKVAYREYWAKFQPTADLIQAFDTGYWPTIMQVLSRIELDQQHREVHASVPSSLNLDKLKLSHRFQQALRTKLSTEAQNSLGYVVNLDEPPWTALYPLRDLSCAEPDPFRMLFGGGLNLDQDMQLEYALKADNSRNNKMTTDYVESFTYIGNRIGTTKTPRMTGFSDMMLLAPGQTQSKILVYDFSLDADYSYGAEIVPSLSFGETKKHSGKVKAKFSKIEELPWVVTNEEKKSFIIIAEFTHEAKSILTGAGTFSLQMGIPEVNITKVYGRIIDLDNISLDQTALFAHRYRWQHIFGKPVEKPKFLTMEEYIPSSIGKLPIRQHPLLSDDAVNATMKYLRSVDVNGEVLYALLAAWVTEFESKKLDEPVRSLRELATAIVPANPKSGLAR